MTRKQLIKAINDNEEEWSCPEYSCNMPDEEGNTGECCWKCAEKQLKKYEDKIRADAIDDYTEWLRKAHADFHEDYAEDIKSDYLDSLKEKQRICDIAEQMKNSKK